MQISQANRILQPLVKELLELYAQEGIPSVNISDERLLFKATSRFILSIREAALESTWMEDGPGIQLPLALMGYRNTNAVVQGKALPGDWTNPPDAEESTVAVKYPAIWNGTEALTITYDRIHEHFRKMLVPLGIRVISRKPVGFGKLLFEHRRELGKLGPAFIENIIRTKDFTDHFNDIFYNQVLEGLNEALSIEDLKANIYVDKIEMSSEPILVTFQDLSVGINTTVYMIANDVTGVALGMNRLAALKAKTPAGAKALFEDYRLRLVNPERSKKTPKDFYDPKGGKDAEDLPQRSRALKEHHREEEAKKEKSVSKEEVGEEKTKSRSKDEVTQGQVGKRDETVKGYNRAKSDIKRLSPKTIAKKVLTIMSPKYGDRKKNVTLKEVKEEIARRTGIVERDKPWHYSGYDHEKASYELGLLSHYKKTLEEEEKKEKRKSKKTASLLLSLAQDLPKGSQERRAILAALKQAAYPEAIESLLGALRRIPGVGGAYVDDTWRDGYHSIIVTVEPKADIRLEKIFSINTTAHGPSTKVYNLPGYLKVLGAVRALVSRSGLTVESLSGPRKLYEYQDAWTRSQREPRLGGYEHNRISLEVYV